MVTIVNMAFVAFVGLVFFFFYGVLGFHGFHGVYILSVFMIYVSRKLLRRVWALWDDCRYFRCFAVASCLRIAKTPLNGIEWNQN